MKYKLENSILFLILAVIYAVIYNCSFSFAYSPITEGWFSVYGKLINDGQLPYKDFYLYITPLYPYLISKLQIFIGQDLFGLRLFGVFVGAITACLIYKIYELYFLPTICLIATIVSYTFLCSGVAFINYDFTQILTLFNLSVLYCLISGSTDVKGNNGQRLNWVYYCFAGVFAALAFLTKQSNGLFTILGSLIAMIAIETKVRANLRYFIIGLMAPILICFIWLIKHGIFSSFVYEVFHLAIQSKGGGEKIFTQWLSIFGTLKFVQTFVGCAILTTFIYILRMFFAKKNPAGFGNWFAILGFSSVVLALLFAYYNVQLPNKFVVYSYVIVRNILYITLAVFVVMLLIGLKNWLWRNDCSQNLKYYIFVIFSLFLIWGNGTSAGISEISLFLPFGLVLGIVCKNFNSLPFEKFTAALVASALFVISYPLALDKYAVPYQWWGIQESAVNSPRGDDAGFIYTGLSLSESTSYIYSTIINRLEKYEGLTIYTFPNIPIVSLYGHFKHYDKSLVQWFDFMPDIVAHRESIKLESDPPEVIVELDMPEVVWTTHEMLFRNGSKSAQREIKSTLKQLTATNALYSEVDSISISDGYVITIWKLK